MKSILWADVRWDHMGGHSGLVALSNEVASRWGDGFDRVEVAPSSPTAFMKVENRLNRLFGLTVKKPEWSEIQEKWSPFYSEKAWNLEKTVSRRVSKNAPDYIVLECIEDQLFLLSEERKSWTKTRLVGITHQPPAWWRLHGRPDIVRSLDLLVIVASEIKSFWSQFIDPDRIVFLPVGVDIKFFFPLRLKTEMPTRDSALRVVFSGKWLRDFVTLSEVVQMADRQALNITFDLIVPRNSRQGEASYKMALSPRVRWHANLSSEELRAVYQKADILLLTLVDATANCALLEGMACGIPVIVTDVGGVRDYANEKFTDFVKPGDPSEIVNLLKRYLGNQSVIRARGDAARFHVEQNLPWGKIGGRFLDALTGMERAKRSA